MNEHEFTLQDRITKIKSINDLHNLESNSYISFSGGKDSTVLHYLIDEVLPGNKIPRVFINTGIEYKAILQFVKEMAAKDDRFVIWTVGKNIRDTLNKVGYPFKSKEHSKKICLLKNGSKAHSVMKYFREEEGGFSPCPKQLLYQKEPSFTLNISDQCCYEFKKKPAHDYIKQSGRYITLTGMMKSEGGQRTSLNCIVTDDKGKLKKFHPLSVVSPEWEEWYIQSRRINLCPLYYPPFEFKRTGCAGCPFSIDLQAQIDTLNRLAPAEAKRCELLWKPVYNEYRRIGYRLRKEDNSQPSLFSEGV